MAKLLRPLWNRWTKRYVPGVLKKGLDGVTVLEEERLRTAAAAGPLILACTHVGWWDGPMTHHVSETANLDIRVMMDADNLRRLGFLVGFGGFPLERSSKEDAKQSLENTAGWLSQPGRAAWIYPQGKHTQPWMRPFIVHRGVAVLQELSGATIVPITFDYPYRHKPTPRGIAHIGEPIPASTTGDVCPRIAKAWEVGYNAIGEHLNSLTAPAPRPPKRAAFPERALAWIFKTFFASPEEKKLLRGPHG